MCVGVFKRVQNANVAYTSRYFFDYSLAQMIYLMSNTVIFFSYYYYLHIFSSGGGRLTMRY
jgi:hypothetical protein